MNTFYPLIITSIAGFAAMLGNLLLFINKKYERGVLSFSLGLSCSVMFLISILELIPEGLLLVNKYTNSLVLMFYSLCLLMIGYIFVNFTDKHINKKDSIYRVGVLSAISLLIHNIPEGIICALTSYSNLTLGLKMSFLILIHNITEGIAICLPIYYATGSKKRAIILTFISSFGELAGALITMIFLKNYLSNFILYIVLIITAGIMITLSLGKIFKEGIKLNKLISFIIGLLVGTIIVIITI